MPCIACGKEVEEAILACPYCGTVAPKRVMLVPCRVCGEEVGKTARRCPYCKNPNPYGNRNFRGYLVWVLFIAVFFYLPIMGELNPIKVWGNISLGHIFQMAIFGVIIWLFYKELKDASGLTKFSLFWKATWSSSFIPCLKCNSPIPNKTKTCPSCGEPIHKNI